MRKWEKHKTSKWVRSPYVSAFAYAYVGGVLNCYVYVMLMRLREPAFNDWSREEQWISLPENLNVFRDEVEGNIQGNKIHFCSRDQ